jgi:XTP/dITP diphosphohydrolase
VPYLLEEAHEAVEAIESGDRGHMVEELGDLLLQVAFQSRVGEEDRRAPFTIDDVAAGIVEKLVRRHPHVFADVDAATAEQVSANWEQIKAAEKPGRTSPFDGIPAGMPPLARAVKVASRLERAGRADLLEEAAGDETVGGQLLALVLEARRQGADPGAALREALRTLERSFGATP